MRGRIGRERERKKRRFVVLGMTCCASLAHLVASNQV
jgi:hypothetical protein